MNKHKCYIYTKSKTWGEDLALLYDNLDTLSSKYCIALTKLNHIVLWS